MIFILATAIGVVIARHLGWCSVVAVAVVFAVAVGIEGAVEGRYLYKTLKRGLEINATFQSAYLVALCVLHNRRLLGRPGA